MLLNASTHNDDDDDDDHDEEEEEEEEIGYLICWTCIDLWKACNLNSTLGIFP